MKILVIGAAVVVAGFGVMAATRNSAEKTLSKYLHAEVTSADRYETICDKDLISHAELTAYYNRDTDNKSKWKTTDIRHTDTVGNISYFEADHEDRGNTFTPTYLVRSEPGGGYCVDWTHDGRVIGDLDDLIRYPNDKLTAYVPVELDDYYNYDFSDSARTHMSLRVQGHLADRSSPTIYIPYNGNEELYSYVRTARNPVIKGVVSREYTTDLDAAKVDEYNNNLYASAREVNSIARDHGIEEWEPTYIQYSYSYTTDDPSILYMPTAVPVKGGEKS